MGKHIVFNQTAQ